MAISKRCAVVAALGLLGACGDKYPNEDAKALMGAQSVFTRSCAQGGCHSGSKPEGRLSLEAGKTRANVVNVEVLSLHSECPNATYRVAPFDLEASCFSALLDSGVMPLEGELSEEDKQVIFNWIAGGAPE